MENSPSTSHLSESLEDYLEAILQITGENGVAWPRDIARVMAVSNASVTGALRALAERDLINYVPYMSVTLTAKGKEHAREITRRHETLRGFLRDFLEVEPTLADETACKMEHILSPEIIQKFARLASFVQSIPCGNKQWLHSDGKPACGQCEICTENECQGKAPKPAGN